MFRGIRERVAHHKQHHEQPESPRGSPRSRPLRILHLGHRNVVNAEHTVDAAGGESVKHEDTTDNQENEEACKGEAGETCSRSVNDFSTAEELKRALLSCQAQGSRRDSLSDETAWLFSKNDRVLKALLEAPLDNTNDGMSHVRDKNMDWVLENFDAATTEQQTLDHELRRLLVLKSFLILDANPKESFDNITARAQETFQVPMCMISLVDLGRQWFLSRQGLDVPETPRNISFCTHAIQSTLDVFEVPNATEDDRFRGNPLVTGPPHVQYYAGVPLVSPEGYKIGTLCLVDCKTHDPMTLEQRECLKTMAAQAVRTLVRHRRKMSMWFNNLVSTHFPDVFEIDESDDEERYVEEEHDQDFTLFIQATDKLSMKSLVDMLQEKAEEQQHCPLKPVLVSDSTAPRRSPRGAEKRVHFDADANVVCNVESWRHMSDLWISADEFEQIRAEKRQLVRYFRKNRPDYKEALNRLAREQNKEKYFRKLLDSNVRGLESRLIELLSSRRKATRKAVVRAQCCYHDDIRGDDYDYAVERIRLSSLHHSQVLATFASNLAQVDHIDALFNATKQARLSPAA